MLTIIFSWILIFIVIFFVGKLFVNSKIFKSFKTEKAPEWYEYFWMGFAATVAILQVWSFFLPVNIYSFVFISFLALISIFIFVRKEVRIPKVGFLFIFLSTAILIAISYFASLSGGWPDTYGYHITSVKWSNFSRVVPGLANLYTRLGFNSSSFLYEAMVGNLYLKDRASHVALSLLASALSVEFLWIFLRSKKMQLKIFILLSLPVFIEAIIHSVQVSSFSYDFALLIIILAICVELIKWDKSAIYISAILSFLLITVKLSGIVFSFVTLIFVLYFFLWETKKQFQSVLSIFLMGIVMVVPYIVRNIILSGWPFYPLPFLKLNLPWTMQNARVVDLFNVIRGWAIAGSQWHKVVDQKFLQWFPGWYSANSGHIEIKIFIFSAIFLTLSLLLGQFNKKNFANKKGILACLVASLASIAYLMFSAPDFRFGAIYFWVFFASVAAFFLINFFEKKPGLLYILMILSLFLIFKTSWPPRMDSEIILRSLRWDQAGGTDHVLINPVDGSPSFTVNMAREDSSCSNADLPCTSEVSNYFKEITPGNIYGGYMPVR